MTPWTLLLLCAAPVVGPEVPLGAPVRGLSGATQDSAAAAFDGTRWLVVWRDDRVGRSELWGARVSAQGMVEDADGLRLGAAITSSAGAAVAAVDGGFVVGWDDNGMRAARLGATGTLGTPASIGGSPFWGNVAMASDGTRALACWSASSGTTCRVLDASGRPVGTSPTLVDSSAPPADVSVAHDGTHFVVARTCSPQNRHVCVSRIAADGTKVGMTAETASMVNDGEPSIACGAGTCLLAFLRAGTMTGSVLATRVTAGALMDSPELDLGAGPTPQLFSRNVSVAFFDGAFHVFVNDPMSGVSVRRVSAAGVVAGTAPTPVGQPGVRQVSATAGGAQALLAWTASDGSNADIAFTRVSAALATLDTPPVVLTQGLSSSTTPQVTAKPNGAYVAWVETTATPTVHYAEFTQGAAGTTGTLTGFAGLTGLGATGHRLWVLGPATGGQQSVSAVGSGVVTRVDSSVVYPSIACNWADCLLLAQSRGAGDSILARRLTDVGAFVDAGVVSRVNDSWAPTVSWDGQSFRGFWSERGPGRVTAFDLGSTGQPTGAVTVLGSGSSPRLSSSAYGAQSTVAWFESSLSAQLWSLASGAPLVDGGVRVATPSEADQDSLRLSSVDEQTHLLVYAAQQPTGVMLLQVSSDGGWAEPPLFIDGGLEPALARVDSREFVLAYTRDVGTSARLFARTVSIPCTSGGQCASGQCMASRCVPLVVDAGPDPRMDAGVMDAGVMDGGAGGAGGSGGGGGGVAGSGGTGGTGTGMDAGAGGGGGEPMRGCGCDGSAGLWSLGVLVLALVRRRGDGAIRARR